jgi:hypothetical protein
MEELEDQYCIVKMELEKLHEMLIAKHEDMERNNVKRSDCRRIDNVTVITKSILTNYFAWNNTVSTGELHYCVKLGDTYKF